MKVWKDLGLTHRDAAGAARPPRRPAAGRRLRRAGELGLPVLIHTADPVAFFEPARRAQRAARGAGGPARLVVRRARDTPRSTGCSTRWTPGSAARPARRSSEPTSGAWPRTSAGSPGCSPSTPTSPWTSAGGWPSSAVNPGPSDASSRRTRPGCCSARTRSPSRPSDYRLWFRFLETDDEYFSYAPGEEVHRRAGGRSPRSRSRSSSFAVSTPTTPGGSLTR